MCSAGKDALAIVTTEGVQRKPYPVEGIVLQGLRALDDRALGGFEA